MIHVWIPPRHEGDDYWAGRELHAKVKGTEYLVHAMVGTHCWEDVRDALAQASGAKLLMECEASYRLSQCGINYYLVPDGPHVVCRVWGIGRNERNLIDRADLRGLLKLARRCEFCKRHMREPMANRPHNEYWHYECLHAELERQEVVRTKMKEIHLVNRYTKALKRLTAVWDVPLTLKECTKLFPYRISRSALYRLMLKGHLESTMVDGQRRVTGRALSLLIQQWIDTGRAPCRAKPQASTKREPHNATSQDERSAADAEVCGDRRAGNHGQSADDPVPVGADR